MEANKIILLLIIVSFALYTTYDQYVKTTQPTAAGVTYSIERKLVAEISDIAGYHYRRELEINQSWERLLNSCVGLQNTLPS